MSSAVLSARDEATARKARGAYFTPASITRHLATWAIRRPDDVVLEPSAGEAAFLVAATRRLSELGVSSPSVYGFEIHPPSAEAARSAVAEVGGRAHIDVRDFFLTSAAPTFDAVIGNPPFVRYQDFAGTARERSRSAALAQGVSLTGLASSWAAFVVHSAAQLRPGGRLGMVLPAELLTVNYAAPLRRFLLERFASVELVTFERQIFDDAEADTVLVKADGWGLASAGHATLRQTRDAESVDGTGDASTWLPADPADRWQPIALHHASIDALSRTAAAGTFVPLEEWGDTSLGAVTGANRFFTLSPARIAHLGIPAADLLTISPPGSGHLRRLDLSTDDIDQMGRAGAATRLLWPSENPADTTLAYIHSGRVTGVDEAYKCRTRKTWWRVPVLPPPHLFLTYMNADTPRLSTNRAGARHVNSVHGVYLHEHTRHLGSELLPVSSLNSLTLLAAELAGRSYGGGVLKIEPREADRWLVPSPQTLTRRSRELHAALPTVRELLTQRQLIAAVELVDGIVLRDVMSSARLAQVRTDHRTLARRRLERGRRG